MVLMIAGLFGLFVVYAVMLYVLLSLNNDVLYLKVQIDLIQQKIINLSKEDEDGRGVEDNVHISNANSNDRNPSSNVAMDVSGD